MNVVRRLAPGLLWLALAAAAPAVQAAEDQDGAARKELEEARAAVGKWVNAQQLLLKERKDWEQGRELLQARIDLIGGEIEQLELKRAETKKALADLAGRRGEVQKSRADLVGRAASLEETVSGLERRVRGLMVRLPDPLREKVTPLLERMPAEGSASKISVAERFQNVLGILNEINKANAEITLASEIRSLSDGKPSEVRTIYLGLGQAWYLSAGGEAGVGRPGESGWVFTADNRLKESVMQVIEVLQNKSTPHFVQMPVRID